MSDEFARLKQTLGTIHDLERVASLLAWDQEAMMPPQGAEAESVLEALKEELVPLVAAVPELDPREDLARSGPFDLDAQRRFSLGLLRELGFEPDAWRLDRAEHPFAMAASLGDIRITTHF